MKNCTMCPRKCRVDRSKGEIGFCMAGPFASVAHVQRHFWEEPCISGQRGSGTVFFSGCNLKCVFCQNHKISRETSGICTDSDALSKIFLSLQGENVHNINLVTPTHYILQIKEALVKAKDKGLFLPIIYNSGGYEDLSSLKMLEGLIDVYLPDIKYYDDALALIYSNAPNYFLHASQAVLEMQRQVGKLEQDDMGIIKKGLIIRHLVLPGHRNDSIEIIKWIGKNMPKDTYISLLSQYTPQNCGDKFPNLDRKITSFEYNSVVKAFFEAGFINGYIQEKSSSSENYIPNF